MYVIIKAIQKKEYEKSLGYCNNVLAIVQDHPQGLFRRAQCYSDLHQWENAINDVNKSLQLGEQMEKAQKGSFNLLAHVRVIN